MDETPSRILRRARWAEALYAAFAMLVSLSVRGPLSPSMIFGWFHWTVTALVAGFLVLWLGNPSRASWYTAAILSVYSLFPALSFVYSWTLFQLGFLTMAIGLLPWLAQLAVAVACWRSRALRHGDRSGVQLPGSSRD